MRQFILGTVSVLILTLLVVPQALAQEASSPPRLPDASLALAPTGSTGVVRAIADFNGDGIDDILVQRQERRATVGTSRQLELFLGPVTPTDPAARPVLKRPDVMIRLNAATAAAGGVPVSTAPVLTVDVNQDGIADIVVFQSARRGRTEWQRVAIMYGRPDWPATLAFGQASLGDVVIERERALLTGESQSQTAGLAVEFGDVNGDGHLDLMVATTPVFADRSRHDSDVSIMFGRGNWPRRGTFRSDARITGLGPCGRLGPVGDLTGNGVGDITVVQCVGGGLPDKIQVVEGGIEWPAETPLPTLTLPPEPREPPRRAAVPEPPPGGGGYLREAGSSRSRALLGGFDTGPLLLLEDFNDDGVLDIAFEFGDMAHVFDGGADIGSRVAAGTSSRVLLNASFGGAGLSRAWRRADLDGNGTRDLLIGTLPERRSHVGRHGHSVDTDVGYFHFYRGGRPHERVFDALSAAPDEKWLSPATIFWGIGDLNGDGLDDVLLGRAPGDSTYSVVFGPFTSGGVGR